MAETVFATGTEVSEPEAVAVNPFGKSVLVVGLVLFVVLMALSGRYGFNRDELYFLDSGRHLSGSYVDQGAVGPLFARITLALFGVSLPGLRLWPALCAAGTVIAGGLTAREFGGGRRAQLLTAIAVACMPALLANGHLGGSSSYMLLGCSALGLAVARIGRTGNTRWWLAGGAIAGIGTDDNHLVGILAAAITVCALCCGRRGRAMILNRWFAAGAAIAVACVVPDLWWQATHGWATFAMTAALNQKNGGSAGAITFLIGQLVIAGVATIWVWAAGLRFLWESGRGPDAGAREPGPDARVLWRAMAMAYILMFVVFMLTTGKQAYYVTGNYVYLLAAGFVTVDEWLHQRLIRLWRLLAAMAVTTAVGAVTVLPILPASDVAWTYRISPDLGESIGWPQLTQTVRGVWFSLPAAQRANGVIYASNYAEEGAVNELGRSGPGTQPGTQPGALPGAVGGHNTDWWWGPGNPRATTVVVIAADRTSSAEPGLRRLFSGVRVAATLSNPDGVRNTEWHGHVYICTGPRQPWGQLWPKLRHYD